MIFIDHTQSARVRPIATDVAWSLCLSVCSSQRQPCKRVNRSYGWSTRVGQSNYYVWARIPPGEGTILGVVSPLKCIRLYNQPMAQQHGLRTCTQGTSRLEWGVEIIQSTSVWRPWAGSLLEALPTLKCYNLHVLTTVIITDYIYIYFYTL